MNKEQWEFLLGDWQDCRESLPSSIETKSVTRCSQHFSKQGMYALGFPRPHPRTPMVPQPLLLMRLGLPAPADGRCRPSPPTP